MRREEVPSDLVGLAATPFALADDDVARAIIAAVHDDIAKQERARCVADLRAYASRNIQKFDGATFVAVLNAARVLEGSLDD